MRPIAIAACIVGAVAATTVLSTSAASAAADPLRRKQAGCYTTIQPAVNAAHDGDTILIAPGTYPGGVTVGVSVTIVGAGAGSTIIRGGGPVLTLGVAGAPNPPTISISGVTVTGGVATGDGNITFVATGGGVRIPGSTPSTAGATVTIRNSVITGNRATPSTTVDSGEPCRECQLPVRRGLRRRDRRYRQAHVDQHDRQQQHGRAAGPRATRAAAGSGPPPTAAPGHSR